MKILGSPNCGLLGGFSRSLFYQELHAAVQQTILLGVGTLGFIGLLSILTSRWITQPLQKLLQASQSIAQGKILDLSKIEAGRMFLEESSFDLYQLLEVLKQTFHLKANSKGLTLKLACAPNVPQFIRIDEGKLRQVLINLLGNAIKFTESGEVVLKVSVELGDQASEIDTISRFSSSPPSKHLKFQISDTGPGISPEEQKQLFHALVQTETGQRSHQGTGLGLTISQKFVRLMGGQITLNSTVGVGTTFQFTLSVIPASKTEIQSDSMPQVSGLAPGQPQYRILVVDDVATNRQVLVRLLTSVGFQQVQAVKNGLQAIEYWESWKPHLIWMAMRMPVMDGYAATRQIKATLKATLESQPNAQSTVIIALTSDALEQQQSAILASGCDDIVLKPFQEEVIFAKMAEYLGIQYTYEESKTLASPSPDSPPQQVTPEDLHLMSTEWQAQLHQAAIIGNDCRMRELVAHIPEDQAAFAAALNDLIEQFEFEQIIHLTQA
ncbi:MAG: ATP-binding protein [Microcoleaceae cyanobacterium]